MAVQVYPRAVKALFGAPCTEDSEGLWIAKGRGGAGIPLSTELDHDDVLAIQEALYLGRRYRRGRFWYSSATRQVKMMIGSKNRTKTLYY